MKVPGILKLRLRFADHDWVNEAAFQHLRPFSAASDLSRNNSGQEQKETKKTKEEQARDRHTVIGIRVTNRLRSPTSRPRHSEPDSWLSLLPSVSLRVNCYGLGPAGTFGTTF